MGFYSYIVKYTVDWLAFCFSLFSEFFEVFSDLSLVRVLFVVFGSCTVVVEVVMKLKKHWFVCSHLDQRLQEDIFFYFSETTVNLDKKTN